MFNIKKICLLGLSILALAGCNNQQQASNEIKVGTIAGPETRLMEVAKQVAQQRYNLDLKIVEFSDYTMPNTALNDGSIDANMFQHKPYLDEVLKNQHYPLVIVGKTFIYPMGIYSSKYHQINQVPDNAVVAVPNDPTNEARALLLLSKAGLITLKPQVTVNATPADIVSNPKHLQIKELDAAQLPRVLPDVALAVINTNYAILAGLYPNRDALLTEGVDSLYANIIVARKDNANDPRIQKLVLALHSPQVIAAAKNIFKDQAIPAWENAKIQHGNG